MTASFDTAALSATRRRRAFATQVVPVALYTAGIFYFGLIPLGVLPEVGFIATDKLLHTAVFGGLSLLAARALNWLRASDSIAKKLALGALVSSMLGLLLEICQAFVPFRSADPFDWLADTIGAILAAALALGLWRGLYGRVRG